MEDANVFLKTLMQEIVQAVQWLHEHGSAPAAHFLGAIQENLPSSGDSQAALNQLMMDPESPDAVQTVGQGLQALLESGGPEGALLEENLSSWQGAKASLPPLDPLKAYQKNPDSNPWAMLQTGASFEVKMPRPEENN